MDLSLIVIEQIRMKLYDKGPSQPPSLASPATSRDALQPPPLCHDSDEEQGERGEYKNSTPVPRYEVQASQSLTLIKGAGILNLGHI
jgi:hypothetical protein